MRPYDPKRFAGLVTHICERMRDTRHLDAGRLKLMNLTWLCDFEAYLGLGDSLTGAEYIAEIDGPLLPSAVAAVTLDEATQSLYRSSMPAPPGQAVRSDVLHNEERALVERVVDTYRDWTGQRIVNDVVCPNPGYVRYETVFVSLAIFPHKPLAARRAISGERRRDHSLLTT
jgi:hypothetical protein